MPNRVLGSARVLGAAGGLAGVVVAAICDALVAPFSANKVREGLGVFGDVW